MNNNIISFIMSFFGALITYGFFNFFVASQKFYFMKGIFIFINTSMITICIISCYAFILFTIYYFLEIVRDTIYSK